MENSIKQCKILEDTMRYLLYNPLSGKTNQSYESASLYSVAVDMPTKLVDVTEIHNMRDFFESLEKEDDVVVFGGDGSINKIANSLLDSSFENDIYYYPCGTGNDFAKDIGKADSREPFPVNEYIKGLPTVTVNGKRSAFINGVGFGIDGYCCEIGDKLKSENKQPNYTSIAIKGLLFHFKPVNATVVVDGCEMHFKKVWIAPTMFGRYYGGGMMPTPEQDRSASEKAVSLMVFHGSGKIKTLTIFPSIFEGKHVEKKKHVSVLQGKNITVTFDRPASLQIDGETVLGVNSYTVKV
jgi:diacylglycerol kinase family enzyme